MFILGLFCCELFLLFLCSSNNQIKNNHLSSFVHGFRHLIQLHQKPFRFFEKLCSNGLKVCDIDSLVIQKRKQFLFDKNVVLGIYFVCDTCSPAQTMGDMFIQFVRFLCTMLTRLVTMIAREHICLESVRIFARTRPCTVDAYWIVCRSTACVNQNRGRVCVGGIVLSLDPRFSFCVV